MRLSPRTLQLAGNLCLAGAAALLALAAGSYALLPPLVLRIPYELSGQVSELVIPAVQLVAALLVLGAGALALAGMVLRADPLSWVQLKIGTESTMDFALSEKVPVRAHLDTVLSVPFKNEIPVAVPVKQRMNAKVAEKLTVPIDIELTVPIDEEVHVTMEVPVRTVVKMNNTVKLGVGAAAVPIPIQASVPIDVSIPLDSKIRVKIDDFTVKVHKEIEVELRDSIPVEIDDIVSANVPIDHTLSVPVQAEIDTLVSFDERAPVSVSGDVVIDISRLGLELKGAGKEK